MSELNIIDEDDVLKHSEDKTIISSPLWLSLAFDDNVHIKLFLRERDRITTCLQVGLEGYMLLHLSQLTRIKNQTNMNEIFACC